MQLQKQICDIWNKHGSLNTYDKGDQKDFEEFVCLVVIVAPVYEGEQGQWPIEVFLIKYQLVWNIIFSTNGIF